MNDVARSRLSADRVDEILATVRVLVAERGFERVTMDEVAARSGTSKATLYRRWPGKAQLLVAAVRRRDAAVLVVPEQGTFRDDVLVALRLAAQALDAGRDLIIPLIEASRHDAQLEQQIQRGLAGPQDAMWATIVDRWRDRGGRDRAVDLMWLPELAEGFLLGRLIPRAIPSDEHLVRFVDEVLVPAFSSAASTTSS